MLVLPSTSPTRSRRARLHALWLATASVLPGCGGGGDNSPPPPATYFAVEGTRTSGGVPVTICVDGMPYTDPASSAGQAIAARLAYNYGFVGGYRSFAGTGNTCRQRFVLIERQLTLSEYNSLANVGAPVPAPGPGLPPASPPPPPPAPPPPGQPPITPIACPSQGGSGTNGLSLYGQSSYSDLSGATSTSDSFTFDPGEISYNNPNLSSSSRTGSLRASLWAVPYSYGGGGITGYVVASYSITFTNGTNQLLNGESANLIARTLTGTTPPRGAYCMVVTLEQYDSVNCTSADRYCISDWLQYGGSATFQ